MKTIPLVAAVLLLVVGCDRSNPSDQMSDAEMFSEESMLTYAFASDDDPALQNAGSGMHNGLRHTRMIAHLTRFLELSEDQRESIRQLGEAMFTELSAIRDRVQAGELTREEARPLVQDLREQFMDGVRLLLTPDQQAKLDEWLQLRWERGHRHRHRFGG